MNSTLLTSILNLVGHLFSRPAAPPTPGAPTPPSVAPTSTTPTSAVPAVPGLDAATLGLTEDFEGWSATPYQDPAGVWTIGYGTTRDLAGAPVTAETPALTKEQGEQLLIRDMTAAAQAVEQGVHVPLTDGQRAALVDFVYNLGQTNFDSSTLLKDINAGDMTAAAAQFEQWDHAGGVVLAGLLRRRQAEEALFVGSATTTPGAAA